MSLWLSSGLLSSSSTPTDQSFFSRSQPRIQFRKSNSFPAESSHNCICCPLFSRHLRKHLLQNRRQMMYSPNLSVHADTLCSSINTGCIRGHNGNLCVWGDDWAVYRWLRSATGAGTVSRRLISSAVEVIVPHIKTTSEPGIQRIEGPILTPTRHEAGIYQRQEEIVLEGRILTRLH